MLKRVAGFVILLGIAGVLWWSSRDVPRNENRLSQETPTSTGSAAHSEHGSEKKSQSSATASASRKANVKKVSDERRAELLAAIQALEAKEKAATAQAIKNGTGHDSDDEDPPGSAPAPTKLVSKDYILEQIEGIRPMLFDCYRDAKKADPSLASKIPVSFTIGGDPDVGGVVTEAALGKGLEKQTALDECVRETLFDLEIDPPEEGGEVAVRYPFDFSEEEGG